MAHLPAANGGFLSPTQWPQRLPLGGTRHAPLTTRFISVLGLPTAATLPIFLLGAAWFAYFAHHDVSAVLVAAVAPLSPAKS